MAKINRPFEDAVKGLGKGANVYGVSNPRDFILIDLGRVSQKGLLLVREVEAEHRARCYRSTRAAEHDGVFVVFSPRKKLEKRTKKPQKDLQFTRAEIKVLKTVTSILSQGKIDAY